MHSFMSTVGRPQWATGPSLQRPGLWPALVGGRGHGLVKAIVVAPHDLITIPTAAANPMALADFIIVPLIRSP